MVTGIQMLRTWEFQARIFISLIIVLGVCVLAYGILQHRDANSVLLGGALGIGPKEARTIGFLTASVLMSVASLLRMWAGSLLTSDRVMSFRVRKDALIRSGPYGLVRNPIYLADLIAMAGFAFCMPPAGVLLPVLFFIHYSQLVAYEEQSLRREFDAEFAAYRSSTPQLIPTVRSIRKFLGSPKWPTINRDGVRTNALYLLFIPGFIVASLTGEFFHAVIVGLPAVFDWAVLHTRKGLPAITTKAAAVKQRQTRKGVFDDILYAQCWEDAMLDRRAFRIQPDDVVFCITSGGCNALAFLLDNPSKVYAVDLNRYQNFLLELKIACFTSLRYEEMLELMGVRPSNVRVELYRKVRHLLSEECRAYWDGEEGKILAGLIHAGRFERYLGLLRRCLNATIGRSTIQQFFVCEAPSWRERLYQTQWKGFWWWLFTRILLSRRVMTLLFDKAFFQYLHSSFSFGENFEKKVRYALTELPTRENYFLSYMLRGQYDDEHLPIYLRRENFETIRQRAHRIQVVTQSCEEFFRTLPEAAISKFNFTNIFEWMSPDACGQLLRETIRVARDGAILTYRNLLVPRERPESLAAWILPRRTIASHLHRQDMSFIYDRYVVEIIRKGTTSWDTTSEQLMTEQH